MGKAKPNITLNDVKHLAKLANLPITDERLAILAEQITTTFTYVDTLQKTDTANLVETNQVTGLTNIWRKDHVDPTHTFTQEQALQNAHAQHNGFFVVPAIFVAEDN